MELVADRDTGCIAVTGEFTFRDQSQFKHIVESCFVAGDSPIVIDLLKLEFIDSAGLGMLLLLRDEAKKKNRKLILKHPTGQVRRLFRKAKFEYLFLVEDEGSHAN